MKILVSMFCLVSNTIKAFGPIGDGWVCQYLIFMLCNETINVFKDSFAMFFQCFTKTAGALFDILDRMQTSWLLPRNSSFPYQPFDSL